MRDGRTHTGISLRKGSHTEDYLGADGKQFSVRAGPDGFTARSRDINDAGGAAKDDDGAGATRCAGVFAEAVVDVSTAGCAKKVRSDVRASGRTSLPAQTSMTGEASKSLVGGGFQWVAPARFPITQFGRQIGNGIREGRSALFPPFFSKSKISVSYVTIAV